MHARFVTTALLALAAILMTTPARAAEPAPLGFVFEQIEVEGETYRYAVYRPWDLPDEPAAAIVFLHGYGECGTDGSKQLAVGLAPAIMHNAKRWPFVVIFPQKPEFNAPWEDYDAVVLAMLDREVDAGRVDPSRVALTGLSQGGHGSMVIGARHPDRWAAVAPVCGYINQPGSGAEGRQWSSDMTTPLAAEVVEGLAGLPVWLFHGEADGVVPTEQSTTLAQALKAAGGDAKLTTYPGVGHNSWDNAYRKSGLWKWIAEHTE